MSPKLYLAILCVLPFVAPSPSRTRRDPGTCDAVFGGCPSTLMDGGTATPIGGDYEDGKAQYHCQYLGPGASWPRCDYNADGTIFYDNWGVCPVQTTTFTCPYPGYESNCLSRNIITTACTNLGNGDFRAQCDYTGCNSDVLSGSPTTLTCFYDIPSGDLSTDGSDGGCPLIDAPAPVPVPTGDMAAGDARRRSHLGLPVRRKPLPGREHTPADSHSMLRFKRTKAGDSNAR